MLNRLASLARPLELEGRRALGLAIYADHAGEHFGARESGVEGVACVDDVARAVVLWSDLWDRTHLPVAREWVDGLLEFCRWMQLDDGRFINFVLDWRGVRNTDGVTSRADGTSFWHARGARSMAKVWRTFGDERARADYQRARASFDERPVASDVRAVQVLAALDADDPAADIARWCDDIVSQRRGDVLIDGHDAMEPHLWGHIQEGVLALAGTVLRKPELIEIARRSADAYLVPLIERGFDLPVVQPYGAASTAFAMARLSEATGDARHAAAARNALAWFDGRNPAGRPVYDRAAGRVADGVDGTELNPHSGAESNIVGAQALFDDVAAWLLRHPDACSPSPRSSTSLDVSSAAS
ncbi:MAG TPA: hypothetical protein DCK98_00220 [Chloroflexi bacterium]|nr:hypothetical protein [Chloroflexota bacterium]HAL28346.1 hypothetical protein [Chloroflexota bacterium]